MGNLADKAKSAALGFGLFMLLAWPFVALALTVRLGQ